MNREYILDLDKPRELRFGFKALRMIRQKFGDKNLDQLMNMKIDEIPALVYAGLKWQDSTLTEERVESLLDEAIPQKYSIMEIIQIITSALTAHLGVDLKKVKTGVPTLKVKAEEVVTENPTMETEAANEELAMKPISSRRQKKQP